MNEQQRHEMIWDGILPSGTEEWSCPICGRRTLINWEPEFKRTILEAGDSFAIHSVVKSDLPVESLQAGSTDTSALDEPIWPGSENENHRLRPWQAWIDKVDFDQLWSDED